MSWGKKLLTSTASRVCVCVCVYGRVFMMCVWCVCMVYVCVCVYVLCKLLQGQVVAISETVGDSVFIG